MSGFSLLRIAGSALTAQRFRMDVISSNIANLETTRTPEEARITEKSLVFSL